MEPLAALEPTMADDAVTPTVFSRGLLAGLSFAVVFSLGPLATAESPKSAEVSAFAA
jgi:hypothetical protein